MARGKRSAFGRIFKRPGRPGFYIRVRMRGREVVRWAGPDRKTAAEFLADLLRKTAREDLLGEKVVPSVTFGEFEPVLLEHFRARHAANTLAAERGRLRRIVDWFGRDPLKDIGTGDVQDFLTSLRNESGLSIATSNRYASLLSVAFKLAVEKGYARENPVQGIQRPREELRAIPFLGPDDVEKLVQAAGDVRLGKLIRIFGDTGLRRSEALALEWRDVDLRKGTLLVRRSKNRRPRQVELTSSALRTFAELLKDRGAVPIAGPDLVWPEWADRLPQAVSSRFKTVAKRAGFPDLRLHDLRHSFASRLAQAGVPLPNIGALAGHTCWQTTARYAHHLPEGATRAAIAALDAHETERGSKGREIAS